MGETDDDLILNPTERRLVGHVERGEWLDLVGDQPVDEPAMRSWDDSHTVRAVVIREIVLGRLAANPDPHGVQLRGARIEGRLDLENIISSVAIKLRDCLLPAGVTARGATLHVLHLAGCHLAHSTVSALDANMLNVPTLVLMGATVTASCDAGAVNLLGAHIGELDCDGAHLSNDSGPALYADNLHVEHGVTLMGGFTAIASTASYSTVSLLHADVAFLSCDGAKLHNDSGPTLVGDGLHAKQGVFLRGGFESSASSEIGGIRLLGAHLGHLECDGARLSNDSGPALYADGLHVDQHVLIRHGFEAVGSGSYAVLDLSHTEIGGGLIFDPERLEHSTDPHARLQLDGLTYAGLPVGISTNEWLNLLREGTPKYSAQPYQHLAAAHRVAGHDSQARRILIAQRRDQVRRRALTGRSARIWARLTGLTLGYGYQPWRALLGLLAAIVTAVILAINLGNHGGLVQTRTPPRPTPTGCTVVEQVGVGLDLAAPLINTGARARCDTTDSVTGQVLTATSWALRLLAWAFATLFVAGFTGAVRKT
ncbi:hypothetical protein [Amycolatopsis sp. NPDC051716]|uniref:hypothetical protein n=1 Tax=Amycolatopsis sp. NPDC051716 TaxID=3155804 RepID=UPI0034229830